MDLGPHGRCRRLGFGRSPPDRGGFGSDPQDAEDRRGGVRRKPGEGKCLQSGVEAPGTDRCRGRRLERVASPATGHERVSATLVLVRRLHVLAGAAAGVLDLDRRAGRGCEPLIRARHMHAAARPGPAPLPCRACVRKRRRRARRQDGGEGRQEEAGQSCHLSFGSGSRCSGSNPDRTHLASAGPMSPEGCAGCGCLSWPVCARVLSSDLLRSRLCCCSAPARPGSEREPSTPKVAWRERT